MQIPVRSILFSVLISCSAAPSSSPIYPGKFTNEIEQMSGEEETQALLSKGLFHFETGNALGTIQSFQKALDTDSLNEAGMALAYWHIGQSLDALSRTSEACEAFLAFIEHAETMHESPVKQMMMILEMDLRGKLDHARAYLIAAWYAYSGTDYAQTDENPAICHTNQELKNFVYMVWNCSDDIILPNRILLTMNGIPIEPWTERLTLVCPSTGKRLVLFATILYPSDEMLRVKEEAMQLNAP